MSSLTVDAPADSAQDTTPPTSPREPLPTADHAGLAARRGLAAALVDAGRGECVWPEQPGPTRLRLQLHP